MRRKNYVPLHFLSKGVALMNTMETIAKGAKNIPDLFIEPVVERSLAQTRADICLKCPLHIKGSAVVGAAAAVIKKALEIKNLANLRVAGEKQLRTCSVCQCEMRLKIWEPRAKILQNTTDEELINFHRDCWIRSEEL